MVYVAHVHVGIVVGIELILSEPIHDGRLAHSNVSHRRILMLLGISNKIIG
jgi:hypothetical protein